MSNKFKVRSANEDVTDWIDINHLDIDFSYISNNFYANVHMKFKYELNDNFCNFIHNHLSLFGMQDTPQCDFHIKILGENAELILKQAVINSFQSNYDEISVVEAEIGLVGINSDNPYFKIPTIEKISWKKFGF